MKKILMLMAMSIMMMAGAIAQKMQEVYLSILNY